MPANVLWEMEVAYDREELFKLKNSMGTRTTGCKLDGRIFVPVGKGFIISTPWFSSHLKREIPGQNKKSFKIELAKVMEELMWDLP